MEKEEQKESPQKTEQKEAPHFVLTASDPCAVQGLKAYRRLLSDQAQVRAVGEVIEDFQEYLESKKQKVEGNK